MKIIDPFIWLEETESPASQAKVKAWNEATSAPLVGSRSFGTIQSRILDRLDDQSRISYPWLAYNRIFNFWLDAGHPKGVWRCASLEEYLDGKPRWEVLLDLDALARLEGKNWVWAGALFPEADIGRAMIALSDGGRDAVVWREFDLLARAFLPEGFHVPEAKTDLTWFDSDTLLIATDFGSGTTTASGYAAQVRRWERGQELAKAEVVSRVDRDAMSIHPIALPGTSGHHFAILSMLDFHNLTYDHLDAAGRLHRGLLPSSASVWLIYDGLVVGILNEDAVLGGQEIFEGTLVAYPIEKALSGLPVEIEVIAPPPSFGSHCYVSSTVDGLLVHSIEHVKSRLTMFSRDSEGVWLGRDISIRDNSTLLLLPTSPDRRDFFYSISSFLFSEELHYVSAEGTDQVLASQELSLDPELFTVSQQFTKSIDGVDIPYFMVRPRNVAGPIPVLVQAYGGFRIPKLPAPVGPFEQCWLERGYALVLANIRGGGEYGPAWHRAGQGENRQRAFDDFHAVAQALRSDDGISKIAIEGLCNGGLLVGVGFTQRPDLYDAVIMGSPLTDMLRYSKLAAGASWLAEYGNPDDPYDRRYLKRYSPYHNLRSDGHYPPVLLFTSSSDDRVHPGHARKMAALLEDQGHQFGYYENIEGGHSCAADNSQHAYLAALKLHWLMDVLTL